MSCCSAVALWLDIPVLVSYIIGNLTLIARVDLAASYNALNTDGNKVLTEVYSVAALPRAESKCRVQPVRGSVQSDRIVKSNRRK